MARQPVQEQEPELELAGDLPLRPSPGLASEGTASAAALRCRASRGRLLLGAVLLLLPVLQLLLVQQDRAALPRSLSLRLAGGAMSALLPRSASRRRRCSAGSLVLGRALQAPSALEVGLTLPLQMQRHGWQQAQRPPPPLRQLLHLQPLPTPQSGLAPLPPRCRDSGAAPPVAQQLPPSLRHPCLLHLHRSMGTAG